MVRRKKTQDYRVPSNVNRNAIDSRSQVNMVWKRKETQNYRVPSNVNVNRNAIDSWSQLKMQKSGVKRKTTNGRIHGLAQRKRFIYQKNNSIIFSCHIHLWPQAMSWLYGIWYRKFVWSQFNSIKYSIVNYFGNANWLFITYMKRAKLI